MPTRIKNITNRMVTIRFNSGDMLHLPSGLTSDEIIDVEVMDNPHIQKLVDTNYVVLHKIEEKKVARRVPERIPDKSEKKEKEKEKVEKASSTSKSEKIPAKTSNS